MGLDCFVKIIMTTSILPVSPRHKCSGCHTTQHQDAPDPCMAYSQSNIGSSVSVWDRIPLDITSSHMRLGTETGKRRSECRVTVGHQRSLNYTQFRSLGIEIRISAAPPASPLKMIDFTSYPKTKGRSEISAAPPASP